MAEKFTPEEIRESLVACHQKGGCTRCIFGNDPFSCNAEDGETLGVLAAKAIEEQAAVIARLREELRWIPVEEQMPKKEGRYHCIVKSFAFPGQSYQALLFCDSNGFREGNIYTDDVTHWKPMLKGPEAE